MEYEPERKNSDYPKYISLECTEKIMEQMKSKICKLKLFNGNEGTGFFCKTPFPNKIIPALITNNHIIDEKELNKENQKIYYSTYNDKESNNKSPKYIELKNRMKYTSKKYDVTIIEIKESDNINNFLDLELEINNINYNKETIYILHYPSYENISVSDGIINNYKEDKEYEFSYHCDIEKVSAGSPILDIKNNKIIGIHKGTKNNYNLGSFINYPIKEFINLNNEVKNNSITKTDIELTKKEDFKIPPLIGSINPVKSEAMNRLQEEYREFKINPILNIGLSVSLCNEDNVFEWKCTLLGAKDSFYKGGLFYYKIIFPDEYPNKGPEIFFITPIYHLNVKYFVGGSEPLGHISYSSINDWKSHYSMAKILPEIFYLINYGNNPGSCYDDINNTRRLEYITNRALFKEKARYFTKKYASQFKAYIEYSNDWDFTYYE